MSRISTLVHSLCERIKRCEYMYVYQGTCRMTWHETSRHVDCSADGAHGSPHGAASSAIDRDQCP